MSNTLRIKPSDPEQGEFVIIDPANFNRDLHEPFDAPVAGNAYPLFDAIEGRLVDETAVLDLPQPVVIDPPAANKGKSAK